MAEIINLRQARKAKIRTEKDVKATENRRLHGRSKQEKQQSRNEASRLKQHLDGHRLNSANSDEPE
ncbi:DUF4169 family protein [Cohaesibacter gelatinilyticus]|uniref:DUF4169 domain-containing protein n=1 Tax=Cohaesibacter gelatinilyticus TaxID=372072 RepID=A0A285NHT0_9HYPH|nr:DUF4169 family protein [Cohaesibacter gelatinilyticus]SNZ09009.1 protein of unknown function [Cohaesibacter gelatinilyticus]HAT86490.1 DUF4169 domain-containing protein [Hyphomicrobiales bacterium]